jgi:hypothetical protein
VLIALLSVTVLSLRPGGLRSQLRYAARRLRLALVLGGTYIVASAIVRIAFPEGMVSDWGLPLLAIALAIVFLVLGQNPRESPTRS